MMQLSFSDLLVEKKGMLIPMRIVAPFESKEELNSEEFNREREFFVKYIKSIGSYYNCTFVEARKLFFEHRDAQIPILLDTDFFF